MKEQIRVAFIYNKQNIFFSGHHFDNTFYNFFMHALKRNKNLDVVNFPTDRQFDCLKLKSKFDIILLWENGLFGMPEELLNIKKLNIPVIAKCGDPIQAKEAIKFHDKWKIDHYFHFYHEDFFHELYPNNFKYKTIIFGLETSLFDKVRPYEKRIKDRILLTGAIGNKKFLSKLINDIRKPKWNAYRFYNLRTKCADLPYVDYTSTLNHKYVSDKYPQLLEKYGASITATTYNPNIKYWENAAAGCLTFMEITKHNRGSFLGYRDGESCIFIDQMNYKKKFNEYLSDPMNPKWKEIANAGREFTFQNYTNDKAVDSLVELMRTLV